MNSLPLWLVWLIISALLIIFEIFTPGFVIAIFSVGSIAAIFASFITDNIYIQLIVFAVVNFAAFIWLRPVFIKAIYKNNNAKTNADALAGKKGRVTETIDNINATGRAKIGGDDWRAVSENDEVIDEGSSVVVIRVEGAKVIVKKIN